MLDETKASLTFSSKQQIKDNEMNFGDAIKALKTGNAVARTGWNGKDMFVFMLKDNTKLAHGIGDTVKDTCAEKGFDYVNSVFDSQLVDSLWMKTADNKLIPWLASQADILAEDWKLVGADKVISNAEEKEKELAAAGDADTRHSVKAISNIIARLGRNINKLVGYNRQISFGNGNVAALVGDAFGGVTLVFSYLTEQHGTFCTTVELSYRFPDAKSLSVEEESLPEIDLGEVYLFTYNNYQPARVENYRPTFFMCAPNKIFHKNIDICDPEKIGILVEAMMSMNSQINEGSPFIVDKIKDMRTGHHDEQAKIYR